MSRVALVIPCFDEAKRLDLDAFRSAEVPGHELELIFVNDGSRDNTLEVLKNLCESVGPAARIIDLPQNLGKAEAVRRGVLSALEQHPDYVGYWDADLATPLSELPAFCEVLEGHGSVQTVFGARVQLLGRRIERRAWRHYAGRIFATVVAQILGIPIYDTQCGAKLFRCNELLRRVFAEPFQGRWIFDVEIVARYLQLCDRSASEPGEFLIELPLREWRDRSGSKVGLSGFVRSAIGMVGLLRRYGFRPAAHGVEK